jgi:hypothetical protein
MVNQFKTGPRAWYLFRAFILAVSAAVLLTIIIYEISSRSREKQSVRTASIGQAVVPVVTPPPLLTKDPEFVKLIHPAQSDDDLLAQSAEFAQKKQAIESQLAAIQDSDLRAQISEQEWAKVDKEAYEQREKKLIADEFPKAMQEVFSKHRADWFEVGHVSFPGTSSFVISSVDASPLTISGDATIPISLSTLDRVYSQFDSIMGPQIEQNVASQVQAHSCEQQLKNVCENLGGSSSRCSNPAELENIRSQLQFSCDEGPSADELRQKAKHETRANRLVLVGQGDLPSHRIDKLMLVDYDTETILLELPTDSLTGKIRWKPLVQSQWLAASSAGSDADEEVLGSGQFNAGGDTEDQVPTKQVDVVGQVFEVQTADGKPCVENKVCWWDVIVEEGGNQEWSLSTTTKPPLEKGQYIRAVAKVTSRAESFMSQAELAAHLPRACFINRFGLKLETSA